MKSRRSRSRSSLTTTDTEQTTDRDETPAVSSSISQEFRTTTSDEEPERESDNESDDTERVAMIFTHRTSESGETEYFVKLRNRSYRDCKWVSEDVCAQTAQARLYTYKKKFKDSPPSPPFFDPAYERPEKIIGDFTEDGAKMYLVKWTALDYDQCTWETAESLNAPELLEAYKALNKMPALGELLGDPRHPDASEFKPLTVHKESKSGLFIRPYQLAGLNFLVGSWYAQRSAILADEMGLGKTLQASVFLDYLWTAQKIRGPFLVVAPLSTIPHWEREIGEWTSLRAITFYESKARRRLMKQYEFYYPTTTIPKFQVLITTYEYVMKEAELFATFKWRCIVIDEAHRLKNHESKLFNTMKEFHTDFKLLLTGTPLQNNTEELWALLNYLDTNAFKDLTVFQERFGELNESDQIIELQAILKPLMLRRLKGDVEKAIAPLEEVIIECPMTSYQKAYYKSIYDKNMDYLTRGAHQNNTTNLRNISMELRKVCNHPYLIKGAEEQILIERRDDAHYHADDEVPLDFVEDVMIRSAGKMILLDKLLAKLKRDGHRVLIFSQMTRMLDILQDYMVYRNYRYERLDGSIRGDQRQAAIDRFNEKDSEDFVFLLCTKAGGLGINLTSADTVIIYDSDWNPQNDIQATARCHRIGQQKNVKAYRFITSKSYERKMFDRASIKLGLDHAVLESSKHGETKAEEMEKLLRLGAYYAFEDTEDTTEKFGEEDIESVLSKSMTIRHESVVGGEGSTFSKAQFELDEDEAKIDVMDPDFWQKYRPEVQEDDLSLEGGTIAERRRLMREESVPSNLDKKDDGSAPQSNRPVQWSKTKITTLQTNLFRYGWGRWRIIYESSKFTFPVTELKTVCHVMLKWLLDSSTEKFPVLEAIYRQGITQEGTKSEAAFTKKYKRLLEPCVVSGAVWKLSRLDLLYFLNGLIMSCENPPDDIPIVDVISQKPAEWWTKEDDKVLLHGTWKFGYLQYTDIKFSKEDDPPATTKLTTRVRSLITGLKGAYVKYKELRGEELPFNCDTLKKALASWSRKEHKQVCSVLVNFGFPSGEEVKRVGNFAKSPEEIEEYLRDVITHCYEVINDESPQMRSLVERIQSGTCARIVQRVELFKKVRKNIDNPKLRPEDRELLKYLSENGLWNLAESESVKNQFGAEGIEGRVIKHLKDMFKDHTKKIVTFSTKMEAPNYPTNEDGSPKFPIRLSGSMTIIALGTVVYDRDAFHTQRYVYPDGYICERLYPSIRNPDEKIWYVCRILDRGDSQPVFRVELKDDPSVGFEGNAPSNPWLAVVKKVDAMRKKDGDGNHRSLTISGPEYFGLSSPVVMYLMSKMENVDKLDKFMKRTPVKVEPIEEDDGKSDGDDIVSPGPVKPLRHSNRIRQKLELVIDLSAAKREYSRLSAPEVVWQTDDVLQRDALDTPFPFTGDIPQSAIKHMISML